MVNKLKEAIYNFHNKDDLLNIIIENRLSSKSTLVVVKNNDVQKDLIDRLKKEYKSCGITDAFNYKITVNKNEFICKVRLDSFIKTTSDIEKLNKIQRYKTVNLKKVDWLTKNEKKKLEVISSQCCNCKLRLSCKYIQERNRQKECDSKFEIIEIYRLVNNFLYDINYFKNYKIVIFYGINSSEILCKLSNKELLKQVQDLKYAKLNTNKKIVVNRRCKKCEKLINIFFDNLDNEVKTKENLKVLIAELEKLKAKDYILNKLRLFRVENIIKVFQSDNTVIITYKIML